MRRPTPRESDRCVSRVATSSAQSVTMPPNCSDDVERKVARRLPVRRRSRCRTATSTARPQRPTSSPNALRERGAEDAGEDERHRQPVPEERRIGRVEVVPRRARRRADEADGDAPHAGFGRRRAKRRPATRDKRAAERRQYRRARTPGWTGTSAAFGTPSHGADRRTGGSAGSCGQSRRERAAIRDARSTASALEQDEAVLLRQRPALRDELRQVALSASVSS